MSKHQRILSGGGWENLNKLLEEAGVVRPFLLCGKSFDRLPCAAWPVAGAPRFNGISPNPDIADVRRAIAAFAASGCDGIVAVGGGSAMDTAKGVKAFLHAPAGEELHSAVSDTGIPLIAVPTTAGSGSESTPFAVLYENGVKYSVAHESLLPGFVLLDGSLLASLPVYQKKCTLLDALCQALESHWSRKATEESRRLAEAAVAGILPEIDAYLAGDSAAAQRMLEASNLAGQAIQRTTTTAAHAMSYKLTGLYGIPHGHAVAISMAQVWQYFLHNGDDALQRELDTLGRLLGGQNGADGLARYTQLLRRLDIAAPAIAPQDIDLLVASVNPQRLGNSPMPLDAAVLKSLYTQLATAV